MWPLAELLPHAGDMILLDRIERYDENSIVAYRTVRAGCLFSQADGSYPAYLGVELMAQAAAAFAGLQARLASEPTGIGFLLGTRKYASNASCFPLGSELRISATRILEDDSGMGVFECELSSDDIQVSARLNVYRPQHAASFIQETTL